MAYEEEEALTGDEKVAMEILRKEFKWYSDVIEYMGKKFRWSEVHIKEDRIHYLDLLTEMDRTCGLLCDLMDSSAEIQLSNLKSLINDERAKFYNYSFDFSHKISDLALKDYLASFQSSSAKNSLPFPADSDSDSKEDKDGKTSSDNSSISSNTSTLTSLSENSSISSNTEPPEMITIKRKRYRGEEEESSDTFYLQPPTVDVDIPRHYGEYHGHHHDDRCGMNFRFVEEEDDYFDF